MLNRLARVALLLAACLALASCSHTTKPRPSATQSATSGIYGLAVTSQYGPGVTIDLKSRKATYNKPSPLPDGFGKSTDEPLPHTRLIVKNHKGAVVARIRTNKQGIFRLPLPPGTYNVWGTGTSAAKTRVVVSPGAYTRAIVFAYWHW